MVAYGPAHEGFDDLFDPARQAGRDRSSSGPFRTTAKSASHVVLAAVVPGLPDDAMHFVTLRRVYGRVVSHTDIPLTVTGPGDSCLTLLSKR